MALQSGYRFPVLMSDLFDHGCYAMGVEQAQDYDEKGGRRTPSKDKQTGELVWVVTVIDRDPLADAGLVFRVTPHSLRHAHASWLLAGGADILAVEERLGHGSIATTERYLHTLPNAQEQALQALRAVRGEPKPPAGTGVVLGDTGRELAEARAALAKFRELAAALDG